jgi:hypothetical protein
MTAAANWHSLVASCVPSSRLSLRNFGCPGAKP